MPSGWTRWLFEQFEFPFKVVYPQELDAGDLNAKFDDIVFTDGVLPNLGPATAAAAGPGGDAGGFFGRSPNPESIPEEFRPWLGRVSAAKTLPQLKEFVQNGGTLLTIGGSSRVYTAMNLPVHDALTEVVKGKEQPVPAERFYVPGSLLRAQVDNTQPVAYGMPSSVDVFYDNSPRLQAHARRRFQRPAPPSRGTAMATCSTAAGPGARPTSTTRSRSPRPTSARARSCSSDPRSPSAASPTPPSNSSSTASSTAPQLQPH